MCVLASPTVRRGVWSSCAWCGVRARVVSLGFWGCPIHIGGSFHRTLGPAGTVNQCVGAVRVVAAVHGQPRWLGMLGLRSIGFAPTLNAVTEASGFHLTGSWWFSVPFPRVLCHITASVGAPSSHGVQRGGIPLTMR